MSVVARQRVRTDNDRLLRGLVSGLGRQVLNLANDALAVEDFAEDYVFSIEVRRGHGGNKELRAVCSYTSLSAHVTSFSIISTAIGLY